MQEPRNTVFPRQELAQRVQGHDSQDHFQVPLCRDARRPAEEGHARVRKGDAQVRWLCRDNPRPQSWDVGRGGER